jgi:hypothetical protein
MSSTAGLRGQHFYRAPAPPILRRRPSRNHVTLPARQSVFVSGDDRSDLAEASRLGLLPIAFDITVCGYAICRCLLPK